MIETEPNIVVNKVSFNCSFVGYSFSLYGCFSIPQNKLKKLITNNDGKIHSSQGKATDFAIVRNKNCNSENSKCLKAEKLNIPIIVEDFIYDSIGKDSLQNCQCYFAQGTENDKQNMAKSTLFKNKFDKKQFQDIFKSISQSTLCVRLNICSVICVNMAEFNSNGKFG